MARVRVYDAGILGGPGEARGYFDTSRVRDRWSDEEPDGSGSGGPGRGEAAILTGNGRAKWVLEKWTRWQGETSRYERLDDEDAREWLERNGFDDAVAEHFGGSLTDALHDATMYGEVTARRDEIIRACRQRGGSIAEIARLMKISRPTIYEVLGERAPDGNDNRQGRVT